jgi:hypothetical protein
VGNQAFYPRIFLLDFLRCNPNGSRLWCQLFSLTITPVFHRLKSQQINHQSNPQFSLIYVQQNNQPDNLYKIHQSNLLNARLSSHQDNRLKYHQFNHLGSLLRSRQFNQHVDLFWILQISRPLNLKSAQVVNLSELHQNNQSDFQAVNPVDNQSVILVYSHLSNQPKFLPINHQKDL